MMIELTTKLIRAAVRGAINGAICGIDDATPKMVLVHYMPEDDWLRDHRFRYEKLWEWEDGRIVRYPMWDDDCFTEGQTRPQS